MLGLVRGAAAAAAMHHLDEVRDLDAQPLLQPRQLLLGLKRAFAAERTIARKLEGFGAALCRLQAADCEYDACVCGERCEGRGNGEGERPVEQLECGGAEVDDEGEDQPNREPAPSKWR